MTTQADTVNWLNSQIGQHLDYDNAFGQQCFDFFNFTYRYITGCNPYADGYQIPSAKDIWYVDNGNFTKLPDSNNLSPEPGDIAVYGAAWGAGNGHVEVVLASDGNGCTFVGENEHNNASEGVVCVYRTWAQMRGLLGVLRPKWSATPPPAPDPPQPRYTVTETYPNGKLIELNKQPTYLWGMNYDFEYMKDHPVETHGQGEVWTVANKVHHEDGYDYYRRDGQIDGFNVADCDDYTPPPPAKPQGAVAFPSPSETYSLIVDLPGYTTSNQAANHTGSTTIVSTGDYQVFTKRVDTTGKVIAVNVTRSAGVPGAWINPDDNHEPIPEPVAPTSSFIGPREGSPPEAPAVAVQPYTPPADPFAWKSTYKPFPDGSHKYLALRDMYITDKAGNDKNGINLNENDWIPMFGSFERDSITYLVPFLNSDQEHKYWYGIPTIDVARGLPNLHSEQYEKSLAQVSQENRQYRRSIGHETTADKIYYAQQYFDKLVAGGARFIDGIVKLRAGKK